MQLLSLASVKSRVTLGDALPFSVRGADSTLLLAAGQVIHDEAQLAELFDRGAVVEAQEFVAAFGALDASGTRAVAASAAAQLPRRWDDCAGRVAAAMSCSNEERAAALGQAARELMTLVDRSTGLAMSQIVRQLGSGQAHYGISHSMNAAIACVVTARGLGWSLDEQQRVLSAAMTMNLSMVDLQGRLAQQVSPLTAKQRQLVQEHPLLSAEMLEAGGITDTDWLDAVREHHELPDGSGYPLGLSGTGELSQLLRHADVYTALMSRRATRPAMSARDAGRELYQMSAASPLCQAMIKVFGVFPPGSFVRLASGEVGVVIGNGEKAYHPRVAALTMPDGQARRQPAVRDTAAEGLRIAALLSEDAMPVRVTPEMLAAAIDSFQAT